jgi:hypothetical protein
MGIALVLVLLLLLVLGREAVVPATKPAGKS